MLLLIQLKDNFGSLFNFIPILYFLIWALNGQSVNIGKCAIRLNSTAYYR